MQGPQSAARTHEPGAGQSQRREITEHAPHREHALTRDTLRRPCKDTFPTVSGPAPRPPIAIDGWFHVPRLVGS